MQAGRHAQMLHPQRHPPSTATTQAHMTGENARQQWRLSKNIAHCYRHSAITNSGLIISKEQHVVAEVSRRHLWRAALRTARAPGQSRRPPQRPRTHARCAACWPSYAPPTPAHTPPTAHPSMSATPCTHTISHAHHAKPDGFGSVKSPQSPHATWLLELQGSASECQNRRPLHAQNVRTGRRGDG